MGFGVDHARPGMTPEGAPPRQAAPFLKWAGGKSRLLPAILPQLPARARTYYEPFVGGGAVFFAMWTARRFERAVISDKNPHLVNVYRVVRDELPALKACLTEHAAHATDSDWYYHVRSWDPDRLDPPENAARLLYLNRTCYNGLYRVNRAGAFNVPFGRYKNPRILDAPRLEAAHRALRAVEIRCMDFEEAADEAGEGDAVYFDPPYAPVSETASFTGYHADAFDESAQTRLRDAYARCCERGVGAVLSNSDCALTRNIYAGFDVAVVRAARAINSAADRRGLVNELLVMGATQTGRKRPGAARSERPSRFSTAS